MAVTKENIVLQASSEVAMLSLVNIYVDKTIVYREDLQELWQLIDLPSNIITSWQTLSTNKVYNWTANTVYKNTPFIIKDNLILIPKTDPFTSGSIFNEAEHIRYRSLTGSIAELSYNAPVETGFGALFLRPATGDGNDIYTKLLMHFNNGNTIKDSSEAGKISTARNGAISTVDNASFGGYSLELNGTNQDLLLSGGTNPGQLGTDLNIANGSPITIDTFITPTSLTGTRPIFCGAQNATNYFVLQTVGNLLQFVLQSGGGGIEITLNSNDVLTLNTRTHVAVVSSYAGNVATYRLFINGVLQTAAPTANNSQITIGTGSIAIGSDLSRGGTAFFAGRIDELRFSRVNRYNTTNFTPNTKEYGLGFYLLLASGLLVELGSVGGNSSFNNSQSAIANTVAQRTNNAGLVASAFVPNVAIIPNQTANYQIPQAILDAADIIEIDQTTAGILFTLANPTDNQRKITIRASSIANVSFDVLSTGNTIQNIGSQRSKNLVYTSTSSWTDATGGSQNIYTVTNTANQTLPAGFSGIVIPNTNTISVTITPTVSAYADGSNSFSVCNLSNFPCYVAGIPIGAGETILLLPNTTSQWSPADKSTYEILNLPGHPFTNATHRNKAIVKSQESNTYVLTDGSDLTKLSFAKILLNVIDANNILVANSGKITTFAPHGLVSNIDYTYGNATNGGIGNFVDTSILTTGYRLENALLDIIDANTLRFYSSDNFSPANPVVTQVQVDSADKRYVLTGNSTTTGINNLMSFATNTLIFTAATNSVYGKFAGVIETLFSTNFTRLATSIPVFGGITVAVVNPNLDPLINNINTEGAKNYIIARNKAGIIFAIPSPVATPNVKFVDAVDNISTITAGQIGFQLNPLVSYRHNGTAVEQYDFILLGEAVWNGTALTSVINYAFNRKHDTGWFSQGANVVSTRNHNIGTKRIKSYVLGSTTGTDSGIEGPAQSYYGSTFNAGSDIGVITNTTYQYKTNNVANVIWAGGAGNADFIQTNFARIYTESNY